MTAWAQGEDAIPPIDSMCAEVEYPASKFTDLENHTGQAEEFLFRRLAVMSGTFSVLNPSPSTIRRTTEYTVVYVVSSEEARTWTDGYLSKQGLSARSVFIENSVGPLYMGSNGSAVWYNNSVALIPNPYSPTPLYDNMHVQEVWNGVKMSYWKRDHEVSSMLNDRSGNYLYPPHCVPGSAGTYFVESTFPLGLSPTSDKYVAPHSAFYLTELPPYVREGVLMVSKKNDLYYDIVGEGTYLSRRFHYCDRAWAPFVPAGSVPIDRYTLVPVARPGIVYKESQGASMVVYSQHRDVEILGLYQSVVYQLNVIVSTDVPIVSDQVCSTLKQSAYRVVDVEPVDLVPYDTGLCHRVQFSDRYSASEFLEKGGGVYQYFTIRVERGFISVGKTLYATAHMRRGLVFVPKSNGKLVVPGFPPGVIYRAWTNVSGFVSQVFLPHLSFGKLPDKPWLSPCSPLKEFQSRNVAMVFASLRDFHIYFDTAVTSSVSWVTHSPSVSEFPISNIPEPELSMTDSIFSVVDSVSVDSWTGQGVTTAMVSAKAIDQGITPEKLRHLFFPAVRVVVWRSGYMLKSTEWVSLNNLLITFPGVRTDETSMNGRSVPEVYSYIRTCRVGHLDFGGTLLQLSPFIRFLENNRVYVEYRYYEGGVRLYFTLVT
jgi:hypothetical protein